MTVPTLSDPSLAQPGKHVMSVCVQFTPRQLSGGRSWTAARPELLSNVMRTLDRYAPGIESPGGTRPGAHADGFRGDLRADRAVTSIMANCRSTSSSRCDRFSDGRVIGRRYRAVPLRRRHTSWRWDHRRVWPKRRAFDSRRPEVIDITGLSPFRRPQMRSPRLSPV